MIQREAAQPQAKHQQIRYQRKVKNILGYISLFILYVFIVIYAVLVQSIESAIAVIFLIISVICNITNPVHLSLKNEAQTVSQWAKVVSYNVDRVLWIIFIILNTSFFIVKATLYYTGISSNFGSELQQMLEVQSGLIVFLPLVLLPFAAVASIKRPKSKLLKDYRQKLNTYIALPLYLIMGGLIVLIQIFSVSLAGLVYFGLAIYLFWMKNFNFHDLQFKILLIIIQIFTTIMLIFSYLTTINYLKSAESTQYYLFYGINSINDFTTSASARGHIICQAILSLLTAYLNRLFIYQSFSFLLKKDSSEFNQIIPNSNLKKQQLQLQKQIQLEPNLKRVRSEMIKISPSKVFAFQKQIQMRDFTQRGSVRSNPYQLSIQRSIKSIKKRKEDEQKFYDLIQYEQQIEKEEGSPDLLSKKKRNVKASGEKRFARLKSQLLQGINTVFRFLNSPQFSLRVVEILSIVVIQRFNNIYSFVALIWLAMVSSIQNKKFILIITAFAMFPMQFVNFVITYIFNIPYSPALNVNNAAIYGFKLSDQMWLDILIFNIYFNYIVLYIKSYKQTSKNQNRSTREAKRPAGWQLFIAFLFRYSYLLTLLGMFLLGFSYPTLMNIILVALFLTFFSNGDNLIISKRVRAGRQRLTLTTFAKKYWFVIVYYTLLCIVAKYIYFLFFPGQIYNQLEPTGINEVYNWSFNFSLSSYCPSNTTPWFIIYVLAQIQIIIYRSQIYTSLSFSIMSFIAEENPSNQKTQKEKHKKNFIKFIIGFNEFYYQSLYYVTGIIIIACSYRWSFIGLAIIILTVIGLLSHFNKKLIGIILFLNLSFIFSNFMLGLINDYPIVAQTLGQNAIDVINKIASFIGLSLQNGSYASLFILNVVIFYFCVLSYGLANVLQTPIRQNSIQLSQESEHKNSLKQSLREETNMLRRYSMNEKSIVQSEFQDEKFAENYQRGVIIQTQNFYHQNLIKKYQWLRSVGKFLVIFWTDMVAIFVILECLFFRVSISMLLFLIIYMVFYFSLFNRMGNLLKNSGYYGFIEAQLSGFTAKQALLQKEKDFTSLIADKKQLMRVQEEMQLIEKNAKLLKSSWKKKIWKFSAILSSICLILTYASQFITSQFYIKNIDFQYNKQLELGLYVIGINVNPGGQLALYIYFYYVMLIINTIDKLIIIFIDKISMLAADEDENGLKQTISELPALQNPDYLINSHVSEHFIEKVEIYQEFIEQDTKIMRVNQEQQSQYYQQANMLIYFSYRHAQIKISTMYGLLNLIIRVYLWLMLINVYEKTNIFAFFYLAAVLIFWFKPLNFDLIRNINKAAIIILCLQYIALLLDINSITSPLPLPYGQNLSLLQNYIGNSAWVDFIAVSSKDKSDSNSSFLVSFIINSIVIFLTQVCFTVFTVLSQSMMKTIFSVYLKYQDILNKLSSISITDPIILNYNQYKRFKHKAAAFLYQNIIMNSYLLVSLLIFILLAGVSGYLALVLLVIAFLYIYVSIFLKVSQTEKIFYYTRVYFRAFNILQFIIILITNVLNIPDIAQNSQIVQVASEFGALTSLQQIFLMLFIQLWIDLYNSKSFKQISEGYRLQAERRQLIFLRGLAFQRNNFLIKSLVRQYKQVLSFDQSISSAITIIKQWHKPTNRQMQIVDYQFQTHKENKYLQQILKQIEEEKLVDDHKQFSAILATTVKEFTDVSLLYNYIRMVRYIIKNLHNISYENQFVISSWSFIKEDYSVLQDLLTRFDQRFLQLINLIGESDEDEEMALTLQRLKQGLIEEQGQDADQVNIKISTPPKLVIDADSQPNANISGFVVPFLLSNVESFIVLFIVIYYMINPCLLSLPLIVYTFCYYIIATRKYAYLIVIYIFLVIFASELLTLLLPDSSLITPANVQIVKFFFATNSDTGQVSFQLPYLYFLFVMLFLSQEVIRYKGNRYRSELEVQNLEQAFLRVLLNEPTASTLNMWKYSSLDRDVVQNFNPFNIAAYQIQSKFEKLMGDETAFDGVFSDRKIGIDVYPAMAAVQILLMIYIIFLYPYMTDISGYTLQQSTKYFQFSSEMVIGVLVHVATMIIERRIAILVMPRKKKLIIKYVYTLVILILFCWFIYYIAPFHQLLTTASTLYNPDPALTAFSFFYFIYFYLSALQIKYGYKEFKSMNSLMTRRGYVNSYAVSLYTAIPFLYQLKIIIDWTFTETSLTLFDWFKQFSIYLRAFKAKIKYYTATSYVLGEPQAWYQKIAGWIGFILIVTIIFGPMILFSGLNPIAETNLVISGSLSVALQVVNGNSFELYQTSHFSSPPQTYNQQQFVADGFINVPVLQQMTASDIPQQFEQVTYQPVSDTNWGIASPNYYSLISMLNTTIYELNTTGNSSLQFQLLTTYKLNRQVAATIASDTQFLYPSETTYLNLTLLQALYATLTDCKASVYIPGFYISLIRLNTIDNTYKPRPIIFINASGEPYLYNATLNLQCDAGTTNTSDTNNVYWSLYIQNFTQGIQLYVYCDKYQNVIGGYGFTALYTSIILVVAGFVRSMFDGNMPLIPYEMNPRPDNILQICEAIATLRVRKQYRDEYLMYYQLIDIIRSPEIMKYMSGSYPYLIEKAYKQKERAEKLKQLQKSKTI